MEKKSDIVRNLVKRGEYKQALRIAKDFRLGITPEQSKKMKAAYECMVHERFYLSLGVDIPGSINEGIEVLVDLYGRSAKDDLHKQICEPRACLG